MSMRIAHVSATFPPYRGGTGNVCLHNALALARRGHEVHVFTAAGGAPAREERDGVVVRRLRPLLRVGNAADRRRFLISQWVDTAVTRLRGHRVTPTFCRSLDEWRQLLESIGFRVTSLPMSQRTPFANVLLVADLARSADEGAT